MMTPYNTNLPSHLPWLKSCQSGGKIWSKNLAQQCKPFQVQTELFPKPADKFNAKESKDLGKQSMISDIDLVKEMLMSMGCALRTDKI